MCSRKYNKTNKQTNTTKVKRGNNAQCNNRTQNLNSDMIKQIFQYYISVRKFAVNILKLMIPKLMIRGRCHINASCHTCYKNFIVADRHDGRTRQSDRDKLPNTVLLWRLLQRHNIKLSNGDMYPTELHSANILLIRVIPPPTMVRHSRV